MSGTKVDRHGTQVDRQHPPSHLGLILGISLGTLVLLGGIALAAGRKKTSASPAKSPPAAGPPPGPAPGDGSASVARGGGGTFQSSGENDQASDAQPQPSAGYQAGGAQQPSARYQASAGYQAGGAQQPSAGYQSSAGYQAGGAQQPSVGYQSGGAQQPSAGYQAGGAQQASSAQPSTGSQAHRGTFQSSGGNYQASGFSPVSTAPPSSSMAGGTSSAAKAQPQVRRTSAQGGGAPAPIPPFQGTSVPVLEPEPVASGEAPAAAAPAPYGWVLDDIGAPTPAAAPGSVASSQASVDLSHLPEVDDTHPQPGDQRWNTSLTPVSAGPAVSAPASVGPAAASNAPGQRWTDDDGDTTMWSGSRWVSPAAGHDSSELRYAAGRGVWNGAAWIASAAAAQAPPQAVADGTLQAQMNAHADEVDEQAFAAQDAATLDAVPVFDSGADPSAGTAGGDPGPSQELLADIEDATTPGPPAPDPDDAATND